MRLSTPAALAAAFVLATPIVHAADAIPYPEDYRDWTHVKSMVILPGHPLADPFQGIHHIYANESALQGYKTGTWPDGATMVFDLLAYTEDGGALQEGNRKLAGVMLRDSTRFKETGGWGYEGFAGDSRDKRLVTDMMAQCHGCHAGTEKTGFVFSAYRK